MAARVSSLLVPFMAGVVTTLMILAAIQHFSWGSVQGKEDRESSAVKHGVTADDLFSGAASSPSDGLLPGTNRTRADEGIGANASTPKWLFSDPADGLDLRSVVLGGGGGGGGGGRGRTIPARCGPATFRAALAFHDGYSRPPYAHTYHHFPSDTTAVLASFGMEPASPRGRKKGTDGPRRRAARGGADEDEGSGEDGDGGPRLSQSGRWASGGGARNATLDGALGGALLRSGVDARDDACLLLASFLARYGRSVRALVAVPGAASVPPRWGRALRGTAVTLVPVESILPAREGQRITTGMVLRLLTRLVATRLALFADPAQFRLGAWTSVHALRHVLYDEGLDVAAAGQRHPFARGGSAAVAIPCAAVTIKDWVVRVQPAPPGTAAVASTPGHCDRVSDFFLARRSALARSGLFTRSWEWMHGLDLARRWKRSGVRVAAVPAVLVDHLSARPWPAQSAATDVLRRRLDRISSHDELDVRRIELESGQVLEYMCSAHSQCVHHLEVLARGLSLPPCCAQHLSVMVARLSEIYTRHEVAHAWASGTLLGSLKSRGRLPWDSDADVVVQWDDPMVHLDIGEELYDHHGHVLEACWKGEGTLDCVDFTGMYSFRGQQLEDLASLSFMRLHFSRRNSIWVDIFPMFKSSEMREYRFPEALVSEGFSTYPSSDVDLAIKVPFEQGLITSFVNPGENLISEIGESLLSDRAHSYHSKKGEFKCRPMWDGWPHHACITNPRT